MFSSVYYKYKLQIFLSKIKGVTAAVLMYFLTSSHHYCNVISLFLNSARPEGRPLWMVTMYSIPSSSPATAQNQEFWAQAKTRCKLGTYQISYILSSTILVPSRNKCGKLIIDHILTSLCFLSKCKMWTINSWHSPKL